MTSRSLGIFLIASGLGAAVLGLLVFSGVLDWFGRLPGDIRIEGEHSRIYIPITSMVLASAILTLVVNVLRRFF